MNRTLAAPPASCTATSSHVVSTPAHAAIGTLAYSAAEITSHTIITRRAGQRSTHAPAGNPMTSQGSHAAAASTPTANVLACSTVTATSGTPTRAMALPSWLIVSPVHSSRKLRRRSSPPNRRCPLAPPIPCSFPRAGAAVQPRGSGLADHVRGVLVVAQSLVGRGAHDVRAGPAPELHVHHQARLDPDCGPGVLGRDRHGERRRLPAQRLQPLPEHDQCLLREPGADMPGVGQPGRALHADQQRADQAGPVALAPRPAAHHGLLSVPDLDLAPGR